MGRPPCCDKSSVKKGPWTEEEDLKLISYTNTHGTGNWTSVPKKAGLKRCGKSCRLRWTNYLRPNLKHESFTPQEEEMIVTLHATIGSRWSAIAHHLPGRTDNDIKNYWNTKLSKKLVQKGIDPITHRPISQVMESIAGIQTSAALQIQHYHHNHLNVGRGNISCLNRNLKNVFLSNKSLAAPPPMNNTNIDPSLLLVYNETAAAAAAAAKKPSTSNEGSSSSTAATAPHWNIGGGQETDPPSPDLDWTEFLVEDALIAEDRSSNVAGATVEAPVQSGNGKGHLIDQFTMSSSFYGGEEDICSSHHVFEEAAYYDHHSTSGGGGGGTTSFIDAILDQGKENLSDFPDFLHNPDINFL